MPYKNIEDRRRVSRESMQRKRLKQGLTYRGNGAYKSKDVNPCVNPSHRVYRSLLVLDGLRLDEMTPQEQIRVMVAAAVETSTLTGHATPARVSDYLLYLQAHNLRPVTTRQGIELVDVTTGELWPVTAPTVSVVPIYEQAPTTRTLRDDITALAKRVTILEAERVVMEALESVRSETKGTEMEAMNE